MKRNPILPALVAAGLLFGVVPRTGAATAPFPVAVAPGDAHAISAVGDLEDDYYVAWLENRDGNERVYLSRTFWLNGTYPGWPANGMAVSAAGADAGAPVLSMSPVDGRVWVAWIQSGELYVQLFERYGTPVLPAGGVPVATGVSVASPVRLFASWWPSHWAFLAWIGETDAGPRPFALRIGEDGQPFPGWAPRWLGSDDEEVSVDEVTISTNGYLVLAWRERGTQPGSEGDLWLGQLDWATGDTLAGWGSRGRPLCTAPGDQHGLCVGRGGNGYAWTDERSGQPRAYVQCIHALNGTPVTGWPADGRPACTAASTQHVVGVVDIWLGSTVFWRDERSGDQELYAIAWEYHGALPEEWPAEGRLVTADLGSRVSVLDSDVPALAWATTPRGDTDVLGVQVNPDASLTPAAGYPVSARAGTDETEPVLAETRGRLAVFWVDRRAGNGDVWARYVDFTSTLGVTPSTAAADDALLARPRPARRGELALSFRLAGAGAASVALHDVSGRRVWSRDVGGLGVGRHEVRVPDGLPAGLYFARIMEGRSARSTRVAIVE